MHFLEGYLGNFLFCIQSFCISVHDSAYVRSKKFTEFARTLLAEKERNFLVVWKGTEKGLFKWPPAAGTAAGPLKKAGAY